MIKAADLFCPRCPTETFHNKEMCSRNDYSKGLQGLAAVGGGIMGFTFNFLPIDARRGLLGLPLGYIMGLISQNFYANEGALIPEENQQNQAMVFLNYLVEDQGEFLNTLRGGAFALGGGFGSAFIVNKTIESKIFCPKKPSCNIDFVKSIFETMPFYGKVGTFFGGSLGVIKSLVPTMIQSVGNQIRANTSGQRNTVLKNMFFYPVLGLTLGGSFGAVIGTIGALSTVYFCE